MGVAQGDVDYCTSTRSSIFGGKTKHPQARYWRRDLKNARLSNEPKANSYEYLVCSRLLKLIQDDHRNHNTSNAYHTYYSAYYLLHQINQSALPQRKRNERICRRPCKKRKKAMAMSPPPATHYILVDRMYYLWKIRLWFSCPNDVAVTLCGGGSWKKGKKETVAAKKYRPHPHIKHCSLSKGPSMYRRISTRKTCIFYTELGYM